VRVLISRPSSICFLRIAAFRSRLRFFIQHLSQAVKFDTQVYVSQTSVLYGATWVRMYQPLRLPFLLVRSVARAKKRVTLTEKRQWQDQCSFRWVGVSDTPIRRETISRAERLSMRPNLQSVGWSTQQSEAPSSGPARSLFPRLIGRLLCLAMLIALALVLLLAWLNERWPNRRITRRRT
jgi:hypothetical protein